MGQQALARFLEPALALKKNHHLPFFLWSFWRVQSPRDGLCCWVCVPSLFCRPEELGSSVADCLRALQTEAGGSLTAGHADQGLQGQTGRPHRLRPVLHSRLSESS